MQSYIRSSVYAYIFHSRLKFWLPKSLLKADTLLLHLPSGKTLTLFWHFLLFSWAWDDLKSCMHTELSAEKGSNRRAEWLPGSTTGRWMLMLDSSGGLRARQTISWEFKEGDRVMCIWIWVWRRRRSQKCQEHGEGDRAGGPSYPKGSRGDLDSIPRDWCSGLAWSLSIRCFTSTPGDSEAQPNWTSFSKGWKHAAFQGKIALGYLGTADISQNTNFVKGYEFDNEVLFFLAVGKPNKSS